MNTHHKCHGLRYLLRPSTSSASSAELTSFSLFWPALALARHLDEADPANISRHVLLSNAKQEFTQKVKHLAKSGQSWELLEVCFWLSSCQTTMYNYSLILIPQYLVCIHHMSKWEQRRNSSFFIASSERANTTSITMEMNNTSFWKFIDKHLFELISKFKMTNGNMPNTLLC